MSAQNAAVFRRWFEEVWNHRNEGTINDLVGPDSVCYGEDGPMRGPEEFRVRMYVPFTSAFPDIRVTVEDVVAERDMVVVRWTGVGTHTCDGFGCPPTGRPVRFEGTTWARVRDGKLVEGWQWSNIPMVLASLQT